VVGQRAVIRQRAGHILDVVRGAWPADPSNFTELTPATGLALLRSAMDCHRVMPGNDVVEDAESRGASVARMSRRGPRFARPEKATSGFSLSSRMSLRSCGLRVGYGSLFKLDTDDPFGELT
jgi:hypothetical protein